MQHTEMDINELFDEFSQAEYTHDTITQTLREHTPSSPKAPGSPFLGPLLSPAQPTRLS